MLGTLVALCMAAAQKAQDFHALELATKRGAAAETSKQLPHVFEALPVTMRMPDVFEALRTKAAQKVQDFKA